MFLVGDKMSKKNKKLNNSKKNINTNSMVSTDNEMSKLILLILIVAVVFVAFYVVTLFVTKNEEKQETQTEATKKSPSKFKRVLVNTKRVNSPNYVGSLSDYFGSGYENGRFINVDLKENKIIIYSNNEDDIYMSADDVESLKFEGKTEWYSSGSVSAIDCMINIVGKDGKQGTIKTPVAKWGSGQNMPYLNTDPINRALKVLGASFRIDIKLYRITFISSKGQTKTDYRIAADDDALKKECESLGEKLLKYDVI